MKTIPRVIVVGSIDPMTQLDVWLIKKAENIFKHKDKGPVFVCIFDEEEKTKPLFSLEERIDIAYKFYGIPKENILKPSNKKSVIDYIEKADRVVCSFNNEDEKGEFLKKFQTNKEKILCIPAEKSVADISSVKLIEMINNGKYKPSHLWIHPQLISVIKNKILQGKK
ncbi:hypothetical protein K8Q94_00945 [Candidatus Nomurabacteria bacterium]|nr:hypothetical protein [Candidatus Nomurabacteria bacterium]